MKRVILKKDLNNNLKKAFENKKISKKEEIQKKEKEGKVEIRVIKDKKKIKVVKGDENLARSWLTQSENDFRERLMRLNTQRTRRLENTVPVSVEAPRQIITNPPQTRVAEKKAEDEFKYSVSKSEQVGKNYMAPNSPVLYSTQKVDEMKIGREKNEFKQEAFIRKSERDAEGINRLDNYVAPQGVDTMSLGRKDQLKRDEQMYRPKLPLG